MSAILILFLYFKLSLPSFLDIKYLTKLYMVAKKLTSMGEKKTSKKAIVVITLIISLIGFRAFIIFYS